MGFVLIVAAVPAAWLVVLAVLFARGRRRGVWLSLLLFAAALAAGAWAIFQSRSSTAGIGLLFLPVVAAVAGFLGWVSRNLQRSDDRTARLAGWVCLASALAVVAWELDAGRRTISHNRERDALQRARSLAIDRSKALIAERLARRPGEETAALSALIAERAGDGEFLLAALTSPFASPEDLDRHARPDELSLTLTALRNPGCRADTLARIHRTHANPDYFSQALAAHPHTPPELLRQLHAMNPRRITGLDHWLARNPATPPDVLQALARSTDVNVIQGLLQNPGLGCDLLPEVARGLRGSARPDDSFSVHALADLQAGRCR